MFTVKIAPADDSVTLESAKSEVLITKQGDTDYDAITEGVDQSDLPFVVLAYFGDDDGIRRRFIYPGDRAWIMNANGKTVASV